MTQQLAYSRSAFPAMGRSY